VPTPFYHLSVAEDLLKHPALPVQVASFLDRHRGAFLLGNTAPDVQVVSGQPREATHFFTLPSRKGDPLPWEKFLSIYPGLASAGRLPPDQAAFLAGYLCHLQADWIWVRGIFAPIFGLRSSWDSFPRRLYLHNVLRAYLDQKILEELVDNTSVELANTAPERWLPFVEDAFLYTWRDYLARQLQPGEKIQTVEVFAARQGINPAEYYHLIASEERMDEEIFIHLPRQVLLEYRVKLIAENLHILQTYLEGSSAHI
jgi:hypothetical protein